jgi:hypothetical protein
VVFSVDLAVSTTGYTIDGTLRRDRQYRGRVFISQYDHDPGDARRRGGEAAFENGCYSVPLESDKGFRGTLRLDAGSVNENDEK